MSPVDDNSGLLLVTRNFPPLVGGMERLNLNLAREMTRFARVTLVAPEGAATHAPEKVRIREAGGPGIGSFLGRALWQTVRTARKCRPGVVLAGSGLTSPIAWFAARASGARAAVFLHGLDVATPNRAYRNFWHPFIRRMDRIIVNSRPTADLARAIGVPDSRVRVVPPGVTMPDPINDEEVAAVHLAFRQEHELGGGPLLLSVGRLTTRKGLLEFVRDVLPLVAARFPEVRLAIIGDVPENALAARAQTPEQILAAAENVGVAGQIHFLGEFTKWDRLQMAYFAADVHVFPVQEIPGDPEGFGMVAVEAAAHGLPTVAFATGGVVDAVDDGISGRLVPPGDVEGFAAAVVETLDRPPSSAKMRNHAQQFAWSSFGNRLADALK